MTAKEVIRYIEDAQRYSKKVGLDNMRKLLTLIGNPHQGKAFVHVAGTNGKGSTCAMIDSVLRAAGYRTGLYTSPYLQRFHERMRVDGVPLSDEALIEAFLPVRDAVEQLRAQGVLPTFFEIGTAVALRAFALAGVDIAVIEVGVGGRTDPTNVILPRVTAIAALGLDHTRVLGETLPEIAAHKAGIAKAGVPMILHPALPEVAQVVREVCREAGAPLLELTGREVLPVSASRQGQVVDASIEGWDLPDLTLGLIGDYQRGNAAMALGVLLRLRQAGYDLPDSAVRRGLAQVRWPGRLEWWPGHPSLLLDGAHNVQGLRALGEHVKAYLSQERVVLLCGVLRDKATPGMLDGLAALAEAAVCTTLPEDRALGPVALCDEMALRGVRAEAFEDLEQALAQARRQAGPEGVVLCAGSLHLIGAVRTMLEGERSPGER